ncbi:YceI family protein [bacterium SCSIO 12696]|nr:YceI family protein [bacterium SCSIO 12696]
MKYLHTAIAALLLISANLANAGWTLSNELSSVTLVTTKATHIAEVHHFKQLSGSVSPGKAKVVIDLASIHTNIDIRDQRMREMLFNTATFASATIKANVDTQALASLKVGEQLTQNLTGSLSLHGKTQDLDLGPVSIVRLTEGRLLVNNQRPILVNAGSFDLAAGVEKLRTVAGLPSISNAVPVSFHLIFEKK